MESDNECSDSVIVNFNIIRISKKYVTSSDKNIFGNFGTIRKFGTTIVLEWIEPSFFSQTKQQMYLSLTQKTYFVKILGYEGHYMYQPGFRTKADIM